MNYPLFELPAERPEEKTLYGGAFPDPDACRAMVADGAFFSSIPQATTFYIVRHGQTEGNASFTYQGRLDYPLDRTGRVQAQALARWLSRRSVELIVASPQRRAAETAEIIADGCGLAAPVFLSSLIEVDVGVFTGLDREASIAAYPEVFRRFRGESWDAVPKAESGRDMYARAIASWMGLRALAERGAKSIVCVSHGGLIQWLIRSTLGGRLWLPLFPTSNCGVSRLDLEPTAPGQPAFFQWSEINFRIPELGAGAAPVF